MNGQFINVMVPPTPRTPRGATWAADAAAWLAGKLSGKTGSVNPTGAAAQTAAR
jgi:hypothetical protein